MLTVANVSKVSVAHIGSSDFGLETTSLTHSVYDLNKIVGRLLNPRAHGARAIHNKQQIKILLLPNDFLL